MDEFLIQQSVMQRASQRALERLVSGAKPRDFLQQQLQQRLLSGLVDLKIECESLLEIGCGRGAMLAKLQEVYPAAKITALDIDAQALKLCSQNVELVCADAEDMQFPDDSFDLIVSSGLMPMLSDPFAVAAQWLRVLKPQGCVCFTSLGPDSFKELKSAFAAVDAKPHVHAFYDMHDVGDAWRAAGGKDVILHCEKPVIMYDSVADILQDLHASGITNAAMQRRRGLTGKDLWRKMQSAYPRNEQGQYPLTLEIILAVVRAKAVVD